ncbi:MAG: aminotransferase class III-fold pyridoxal phosphate-dependent enzyme [Gemmatimonadota bacterium]
MAFGADLPRVTVPPPGPASRSLAARLRVVESPNITPLEDTIVWAEASGANVRDADGNVYVDLTAGFSVAAAGHAHAAVAAAIGRQAGRLPHGLGDVHPSEAKVQLLERLAALAPDRLSVSILASAGAEAVEAALKTAVMVTDRPGVLAFEGAYHGLTYGALSVTSRALFRRPFRDQLYAGVRFAPYPGAVAELDDALAQARRIVDEAAASAPIGAVLVEPVQGRGGLIVPPHGFLAGLRELCDERGIVLIFDEIYTGFGRTGRWFACQHEGVTPDIMTVGKALTGALPLSAAIGTPDVMAAWPPSEGEAIHTSTFLGNPLACAAALAQLDVIEKGGLVQRAEAMGATLRDWLEGWAAREPRIRELRGLGLMQGVRLAGAQAGDAAALAARTAASALRQGVLLLPEGEGDVLAVTPPLVITEPQLLEALHIVEHALAAVS